MEIGTRLLIALLCLLASGLGVVLYHHTHNRAKIGIGALGLYFSVLYGVLAYMTYAGISDAPLRPFFRYGFLLLIGQYVCELAVEWLMFRASKKGSKS